jgi:hypothetical protein
MKAGESIEIHYIAYEVDTHDSTKMESIYGAIGGSIPPGLSDEEKQQHYFHFLVDHIRHIITYQVDQGLIEPANPNRLTIFATPEFYFKDRSCLPFNQAVFNEGRQYMAQKFNGFGNLLIFAGSVWWWEKMEDAQGNVNAAIHNSAPIFYQNTNILNWNKKFLSSIDGLGNPNANWGPATHWDRCIKTATPLYDGNPHPYFTVEVNGIEVNLGIEVCLEHCNKYLQQSNSYLDVHMLVCAGIPEPNSAALACRESGVFLRCDGGSSDAVWNSPPPKAGQPMYNGNRSNCGVRSKGLVGIPKNEPSKAYKSLANRPEKVDERVLIYNPITIKMP